MRRFILSAAAFLLVALTASAQSFRISDFRDTTGFVLYGVTLPSTPVLDLTPGGHLRARAAALWRRERVRIADAWSASITFQITDTGGDPDPSGRNGADGLAFVLQMEGPNAVGTSGYGLGYHGIGGGLAVEVDTWDDSREPEWSGTEDAADHVAIHSNGAGWLSAVPRYSYIAASTPVASVSDGRLHTLTVRYTPGAFAVYLDDCRTPVVSVPIRLDTLLRTDSVWIGVTAATQSAWQSHRVLDWCFAPGDGCYACAPCRTDTVTVVRDSIVYRDRWRDSIVYRDRVRDSLVYVDRWQYDTTRVPVPYIVPIPVPVPVPYPVHDTTTIIDSIPYPVVTRDTVHRDTGRVVTVYGLRDTCVGLRPDDSVCGYIARSFTYQSGVALAVRPNPASDVVALDIASPGPWRLEWFDDRGRIVCAHDGDGSATIEHDVGGLASGRYWLRLVAGDVVRVAALVVER